ncbi:MAG: 3-phosphoshikimate 1-carboxyvinyltransferase [Bacteroidales bacterium]|nr:3-phosphoshikimate 1-carboxyvinyltransferase [Bacteroidales bacterium]
MIDAVINYSPVHSRVQVKLPLSKSISNRMLIMNFLSGRSATKLKVSEADDSQILFSCIETLEKPDGLTVLNVGEAGTAARFLTAMLCVTPGIHYITGGKRMRERPINSLFKALIDLGADIQFEKKQFCFPARITGKRLQGGVLEMSDITSSQFVSALLMIAPVLKNGLELHLNGKIASEPYILMTLELLRSHGGLFDYAPRCIKVYETKFKKSSVVIESDWSSAAPFYSIMALRLLDELFLENLTGKSMQGDSVLADIFTNLGVETTELPGGILLKPSSRRSSRFEYDFSDCPDLAQSVIVTVAALGSSGFFTGLHSLPLKETDRLQAMHNELERLGIRNSIGEDFLEIEASEPICPETPIQTYQDHRMAMAFAPLAGVFGSLKMVQPDVVSKSFPKFWKQIERCGFSMNHTSG